MNLKTLILQAYGTCDFLAGENGLDMRHDLSLFLGWYYISLHSSETLDSFVQTYLLIPPAMKTLREHEMVSGYSKEAMESLGRELYEDFVWADALLNQFHSGFENKNAQLFIHLCETMAQSAGQPAQAAAIFEEPLPAPKEEEKSALNAYMDELNGLIGLDSVKQEIKRLMALIRIAAVRKEKGLKAPEVCYHMVFLGNPGTGKTTVARLIGAIYKELGVLSKGTFTETDRAGLVAGHVGQTALKTKEVIDKALGGVLFIDEAYTLSKESKNDFGQEAIETLLKAMEDHRNDLVVIVAGYPDLMMEFLHSNPGLSSRFNKYIQFPDYSAPELMEILTTMAESMDYSISQPAREVLEDWFAKLLKNPPKDFGNARYVRNLLESAIQSQALRLSDQPDLSRQELEQLEADDFLLSQQ